METLKYSRSNFSSLKSREHNERELSSNYNTIAEEATAFKRLWTSRVGSLTYCSSVNNFKTRQCYVVNKFKPVSHFQHFRGYSRHAQRSLYRWNRESPTKVHLNNGLDRSMSQAELKGEKRHVDYFQNCDFVNGHEARRKSVVCRIRGICPFYSVRNVGHSRQSLHRWKRTDPTKKQLDDKFDCYGSRVKLNRALYSDNFDSVKNFEVCQNSTIDKFNEISPYNTTRNFRHSQQSLYKWKRTVPTKQQLDDEIDCYMRKIKFNRKFNRDKEQQAESLNDRNCENHSKTIQYNDVCKYKNSVPSFCSLRKSPYIRRFEYRWKRQTPTKEQLDEELDKYMYEAKLKRSWNCEKEREFVCYEDVNYLNDSETSQNSVVYQIKPIVSPFRRFRRNIRYAERPYYERRWRRETTKEQLDDELDRYMSKVKLMKMWNGQYGSQAMCYEDSDYTTSPNSEVVSDVHTLHRSRRNIGQLQQSSYRRNRRYLTKDELDDEIDSYMSEVKFQTPASEDDVFLFVQEYMKETEQFKAKTVI